MLTRGGIEFLAVLLGITLSLYIDQQAENRSVAKTEMALLSDLQVSLNQDISYICLLYTSPSPRDRTRSRMPSSA